MNLREFGVGLQPVGVGKSLIFLSAMAVAFFSLWGWGWLMRRCTRTPLASAPLTVAIGLGTVIFLGGLLNVTRIAVSGTLDLVVLVGLLLAVFGWFKGTRRLPRLTVAQGCAWVLPLLVAWFLANYLTPVAGFNYHDDFERYFVYPVRMLATGTLAPNPLGYLGADTLGAEAFLQGFLVSRFPIEYIGSVDLAGGLLLCLALTGFGLPSGRWAIFAIVSESLLIVINPQLVNISSVFSGVALIMAVILLGGDPAPVERNGGSSPLTGLLYAAMIALKTTFAVFVGVHLLVTVLAGLGPLRHRLRWSLGTGAWTLGWLAPWLVLHGPLYLAGMTSSATRPVIDPVSEPLDFFSNARLPYGLTQFQFTGLALLGILVTVCCAIAVVRKEVQRTAPVASAMIAGLTAGLSYLIMVAGLGPLMYGRETAIRYAIPLLMGTLPTALRLLDAIGPRPRWLMALPVGGGIVMTLLLAPPFVQRVKAMADTHVPWAYFLNYSTGARAEFLAYCDEVLHGAVRNEQARIQALVPPHETFAVWTMAPFWLDFHRNTIWHTDPYGIAMPWARWPAKARYFLLQHNGPSVRSGEVYEMMKNAPGASDRIVGFRAEAFLQDLVAHSGRQNIVYSDDTYALVRLSEP